jgi:N-acetylmuramoyl-L-alanine amidase
LAQAIQREQARRFPERSDRGVKAQDFDVLVGANMPAVLFEAGFLDHEHEGAWMLVPESIDRMADGLAIALVELHRESARI